MSTSAIGATSQTTGATSTQTPARISGTREIGQDAFLKLLTTQLQNQDPTKPQDNGEFIAQLATFSSLEKLTTISAKLDQIGTALGVVMNEPTGESGAPTSNDTSSKGTGDTGSSSTTNGGK